MDNKLEQALERLSIRSLLTQFGAEPKGGSWAQMHCPFCAKPGVSGGKKSAGLFKSNGKELFKCFSSSCPTASVALDEIGVVAQFHALNRKEAYIQYLKMAGVWEDRERLPPSVMPGKAGRKKPLPALTDSISSTPPAPRGDGVNTGVGAASGDIPNPAPDAADSPISTEGPECSVSAPEVDDAEPQGVAEANEIDEADLHAELLMPDDEDNGHASPPATQSPAEDATSSVDDPAKGGEASGAGKGGTAEGAEGAEEGERGKGKGRRGKKAEEGAEGDGEKKDEGGSNDPNEGESPEARIYRLVVEALAEFYGQLELKPEDRELLRVKRGLSEDVIEWSGIRSSDSKMEQVLVEMGNRYDTEVLLRAGLYSQKENEHGEAVGPARPEAQLFGLGRKGKDEWAWVFPVLIPYFGQSGGLIHIRAHKGQTAGGTPRLFVVRRRGRMETPKKTLVLTEGEIKALAVVDGLGGSVIAAALPGISMAKHWKVWGDIQALIATHSVDEVVVVYDNEEKGDKSLPSYKADVTKRHDAEIWARYLAERCQSMVRVAKVGRLPKEWRDANGKADWDSALARLRASGATVADEFRGVLRNAIPIRELHQAGLFDAATEQFIHASVRKLFHVRSLPQGGSQELKVSQQLKEAAVAVGDDDFALRKDLLELAAKYRGTLARYYELKPPSDKVSVKWYGRLKKYKTLMNWRAVRGCEKALEGMPQPVSDFLVEPLFTVENEVGLRERSVCLRNVHGERTRVVSWDPKSMASPKDFRIWLLGNGGYSWSGNERNIQALVTDVNVDLAFRTVRRVSCYGWDAASRLWFFKGSALGQESDGTALSLTPDGNGVFWHDGVGYMLGETGPSGQEFRQGHPEMPPDRLLVKDARLDVSRFRCGLDLTPAPSDELELMGCFLRETCGRMNNVFGGWEGAASVSWALAFAAAPEVFDTFKAFPLLFLHGAKGSGKTTVMSWLMEFMGFRNMGSGLGLKSSATAVGLQILLEQYSNLAAWGDEYEHDGVVDPKIQGTIHSNYNRETNSRWSADGRMRKVMTAMAVTGEATMGRAATKSRFISFQVAPQQRKGTEVEQKEDFDWMEKHRRWFFVFFRHLLWNRARFAERLMHYQDEWRKLPELRQLPDREKLVYGIAYASFMGLVEIFQCHTSQEVTGLKVALMRQCAASVTQVQAQVNTSAFWQDVCSAFTREAFGTGRDLKRFFRVTHEAVEHPPLAPNQGSWRSYKLYVSYHAVIGVLKQHLRQQGRDLSLQAGDYAAQMSRLEYWVPSKSPDGHRQRFGSVTSTTACWCIALDRHELGYKLVTDEELRAAQLDEYGMVRLEYADPRKGELYGIVEALERAEEG